MSSSAFEGLFKSLFNQLGRELIKKIFKKKPEVSRQEPKKNSEKPSIEYKEKSHPWRLCPLGEHWTEGHQRGFPNNPAKRGPVHGYCADNPKRNKKAVITDYLSKIEINLIAEKYFKELSGAPTAEKLSIPHSDDYDLYIRGWTRYWNEVLKPSEPLDPDLIKALIASESTFNLRPKDQQTKGAGKARGFIQLTDQAIRALNNPKGELKDHLIEFSAEDAYDPNLSICAGIRWLFRKRRLASGKLGREATWTEAIAEYKAYLDDMQSGKNVDPEGMKNLRSWYEKLKK